MLKRKHNPCHSKLYNEIKRENEELRDHLIILLTINSETLFQKFDKNTQSLFSTLYYKDPPVDQENKVLIEKLVHKYYLWVKYRSRNNKPTL